MCLAALALLSYGSVAAAQDKTPGYNYRIPDKVMTPDTVETRLGTLRLFDGMPDAVTTTR